MSTFLLNFRPRAKILAMPLQYRTWVEFMYEILSDVTPSNQNSWVATGTTVHCTLQLYYGRLLAVQFLKERKMGMQFYVIILIFL